MTTAKTEFQLSATPGEELSRRLAYFATQDNGSVMTGGFAKAQGLNGGDDDQPSKRQTITAMELLAQQEQIRQDQIARLNSQFDALEIAARDALFDAENNLAEILSNANRATDGRAVFKDRDGNVRDEDGQVVDPASFDISEWDAEGSSWEQFENGVAAVQRHTAFYDRVTAAKSNLDGSALDQDAIAALEGDLDALEAEFAAMDAEGEPAASQSVNTAPTAAMPDGQASGIDTFPMKPL